MTGWHIRKIFQKPQRIESTNPFTSKFPNLEFARFINRASNASKILWPARKPYKERGKQLRDLIGVDDHNLLSDRTFRNHFEHYDERIEDWFDGNDSAVYMDSRIDPFEWSPSSLPRLFHRSYNPISQILSFRDESIDLAAVLTALAEIREKCRFLALP